MLSDERYVANRRALASGRDLLAELEQAERECELRREESAAANRLVSELKERLASPPNNPSR